MESRVTWRFWLAAAILSALVVLNLVQYPRLEGNNRGGWDVWVDRPHGDLVRLTLGPGSNAHSRYSIALALRALAPGSTVIVPVEGGGVVGRAEERFLGFGGADEYRETEAAIEIDWVDVDAHGYVAGSDVEGSRGAGWEIILDPESAPVLATDEGGEVIQAYREGGFDAVTSGPARTFVLVSRPAAGEYGYINVLIETSLLTDDQREAIAS